MKIVDLRIERKERMHRIELKTGKKIYFASDFHLGIPNEKESIKRERRICEWLESIRPDAQQIYLLGDLFDAWIEYKRVVPAGFTRFLGKLSELTDAGIEIVVFTGNHDLWMRGYLEKECGCKVHKTEQLLQISGKSFFIGHGDGLSKKEGKYRFMKAVFHHPLSQWIYRLFHPNIGLGMAQYFSRLGEAERYDSMETLKKDEEEYQFQFVEQYLSENAAVDYFVFGHRHIPTEKKFSENTLLINLGDWLRHDTFACFDGLELRLKSFRTTR